MMLLFGIFSAIILLRHTYATSICDVIKPRNGTYFCSYLEADPVLAKYNNQTSNITVLVPRDYATGPSLREADKRNAVLQYHIIRGVHTSEQILNNTLLGYQKLNDAVGSRPMYVMLETYLEGPTFANVTGGQKIGAGYLEAGMIFWTGSKDAKAQQVDLKFDGGLIHYIDIILDMPPRAREKILLIPTITDRSDNVEWSTALFQEALYMTGLMDEIESLKDVTILVPFDKYLLQIGSIFNGMSMDDLKELLSYHIIVGDITYADAIPPLSPAWSRNATTLSGKTVNLTHVSSKFTSRQGVLVNSLQTDYNDIMIANGNMLALFAVLDPNNTSDTPFPNAKNVTRGTQLFANITRTNPSTLSIPSPASNSSSTASPSPSISAPPESTNTTLSTGAKAGIGVGSAAGALGALLFGGWLLRSRRRNQSTPGGAEETIDPEKMTVTVGDNKDPAELDLQDPAELDGGDSLPREELDGQQIRPELPGGGVKGSKYELA